MSKHSFPWTFYTQVLNRALNELESAVTAQPETEEFEYHRAEAPVALQEAREALSALKQYVEELESSHSNAASQLTRH